MTAPTSFRHRWATVAALSWALCCSTAQASPTLQVDALVQPAVAVAAPVLRSLQLPQPLPALQQRPTITLDTHWSPHWQAQAAVTPGNATEVGVARSIAPTHTVDATQQWLQWHTTADGGSATALSVHAPQAKALRLALLVQHLPAQALLRVYNPQYPEDAFTTTGLHITQLLQANRAAGETGDTAHTWWTPETPHDTIALEITLPPDTPTDSVQVALPQVMHIYSDLWLPTEDTDNHTFWPQAIGDAQSCNLDASCYASHARTSNAVARMSYVKDGRNYLCTGTLVNDAAGSLTPYFLTANHCISSASQAASLQTAWFYRSSSCGARSLSSQSQTLRGGAALLHTAANPDITLLRLLDTPPANAVFAGWDATASNATPAVVGIHHPVGDLQKISFGQVETTLTCDPIATDGTFGCTSSKAANASYYGVRWTEGTTENGSSGSGMFTNGRLSGVLSGGSGSCSRSGSGNNTSVYGRLSSAFEALRPWLAGSNTPLPNEDAATTRQPVFRFFNTATGAHFYTPSAQERSAILRTLPTYREEGIGFYAAVTPSEGLHPVERFFNTTSNSHFFTISAAERAAVQANLPQFRYEGPTWYASSTAAPHMQAVHRFYNATSSTHFFTASEAERDAVIEQLPNFAYEGIAYYVWGEP